MGCRSYFCSAVYPLYKSSQARCAAQSSFLLQHKSRTAQISGLNGWRARLLTTNSTHFQSQSGLKGKKRWQQRGKDGEQSCCWRRWQKAVLCGEKSSALYWKDGFGKGFSLDTAVHCSLRWWCACLVATPAYVRPKISLNCWKVDKKANQKKKHLILTAWMLRHFQVLLSFFQGNLFTWSSPRGWVQNCNSTDKFSESGNTQPCVSLKQCTEKQTPSTNQTKRRL